MLLAPQSKLIEKCLRCSRQLTNPVSMYVGFGPICSEYLGIQRPEYNELMKLNPENNEQLTKLLETRQKLEAANYIEGSVTIEGDRVIIKFDWDCQDFNQIKATVRRYAANWNPQNKQWEAPKPQLPHLVENLKKFSNIAIDESLFSIKADRSSLSSPPASTNPPTKLESLVAQMKQRLETVNLTNVTLKNGLQLFLKTEGEDYKVLCVRENVLPSKVEVKVIGDTFFGKSQWQFGKAQTSPPLPATGYVIQVKKEIECLNYSLKKEMA